VKTCCRDSRARGIGVALGVLVLFVWGK
jgi:hypothetical protein